ncbi:MAG: plasmid encoded RepA protein, partial [Rickettsiales bacterium]
SLYTDARVEEKGARGLTLHFSQTPVPKRLFINGIDAKL